MFLFCLFSDYLFLAFLDFLFHRPIGKTELMYPRRFNNRKGEYRDKLNKGKIEKNYKLKTASKHILPFLIAFECHFPV